MIDKWNVYIGIVAEDKNYNTNLIKVYVQEILPFYRGDLSNYTTKEKADLSVIEPSKDNQINTEKAQVKTSNVLTAEYFGLFTNISFSPDVRKGEQVIVIQHLDTDIYYWLSLGRDDNLRQLEKHRISISNATKKVKKITEDNTYYIELDTLHKKSIVIRTSKSDGEKFRYLIHIDAKSNQISIEDDADNYIHLYSDLPSIKLHNNCGTDIELHTDDIIMYAPRDMKITVDRALTITSPTLISNNSNFIVNSSDIFLNGTVNIPGTLQVSTVIPGTCPGVP